MKKRLFYYECIVFLLLLVNTASIHTMEQNSINQPVLKAKKGELKYYKFTKVLTNFPGEKNVLPLFIKLQNGSNATIDIIAGTLVREQIIAFNNSKTSLQQISIQESIYIPSSGLFIERKNMTESLYTPFYQSKGFIIPAFNNQSSINQYATNLTNKTLQFLAFANSNFLYFSYNASYPELYGNYWNAELVYNWHTGWLNNFKLTRYFSNVLSFDVRFVLTSVNETNVVIGLAIIIIIVPISVMVVNSKREKFYFKNSSNSDISYSGQPSYNKSLLREKILNGSISNEKSLSIIEEILDQSEHHQNSK